MIETIELGMTFPDKKLFQNVNLKLNKGNIYGIIGANGAGKSTFLKLISGELDSTTGKIVIEKNKRISVLGQNHNAFDDISVRDAVIRGNKDLHSIATQKDAIYANPEATPEDYEKAAHLEEEYGTKGGWTAESDAEILLEGIGIKKEHYEVKMADMKAGDKVKVLLAQALFGEPDILILDEPTNHLDLKAIKWLEEFLVEYANLVLAVSHDSDFLDEICSHIIDIDFGGAKLFTGNYTFWKESSELALELSQKQNAKKEDKIKKLQEFVARFSANASKSSQASSRKKELEKITLDEIVPSNRKYPFIQFDINRETGKDILRVENLSYKTEAGEILFENLNFSIHKGEKLALIGKDDIAKTKLLEIIMGIEKQTTGKVIIGSTITPDYFENSNDLLFKNKETIMNWLAKWPLKNKEEVNKDNSDSRMRSFLGRMLFGGDSVFKNIQDCSGGEKSRLKFSKMMLTESNFIILDQPLDHLDTESIDSVIKGIKNYKSSCVFTTYNRTMMRDCANIILELNKKDHIIFRGSVEEFEKKMNY